MWFIYLVQENRYRSSAALLVSWLVLLNCASSSSNLLQLYQDVVCGAHGPRQTQQKSALQLWFLHFMLLQPPFFSMVAPHFGHSFVFVDNQLLVSLSSSHFFSHFLIKMHFTGSCQFSAQPKQKECPQSHVTKFGSAC